MTPQEIDSRIELLEGAIDAHFGGGRPLPADQLDKLMFEKLELLRMRSQKRKEYRMSVPGLQERLQELHRKLGVIRQGQQPDGVVGPLVQQIQDAIRETEALLAHKTAGGFGLGSQLPS